MRVDNVSQNEARGYAAAIRPDYITESVDAYSGAPNVNSRGEVIQGNNRAEALRSMYEEHPEQAARYKQYLIDNAERLGIDAEAVANMERPVYVNMFDVDDAEAIKLGHYTKSDTESGSDALDKPCETGQRGREGGTAGTVGGERAAQGQGSALGGGGADSDGEGQLKPDTPASVTATPGEAPADPVNQPPSPSGSTAGDTSVTPKDKVYDAERQVNITPTAAQAAAGNYKKGHVKVSGFNISIENPKGSERKGVDADFKKFLT